MGSFNSVCGVSRTPIRPGDKVRLFFIVSNFGIHNKKHDQGNLVRNRLAHRGLGSCTYDHFTVLGYPMKVTYDDSGAYNFCESDPIVKYNMGIIRKNYIMVQQSEHEDEKYFDHFDIPVEDITPDVVNDMVRDGALYVSNYPSSYCFVQFFPVLEDVYELLLEGTVNFYARKGFQDLTLEQYYEYRYEIRNKTIMEYNAEFDKLLEERQHEIGAVDSNGNVTSAEYIYTMAEIQARLSTDMYELDRKNDWSYQNSTDYTDITSIPDIINYHYETSFAIRKMNKYNIEMVPTMTAGQEQEVHEHAAFLSRVGQMLYTRQIKEDERTSVIPKSVIEVKYADMVDYFDDHWNEKISVPGKEALKRMRSIYGSTGEVQLSYSEALELGLNDLFAFVGTQLLSIKIVR